MVTVDVLGLLMGIQAVLAVVLFLFIQLVVFLAPDRFEQIGDWLVYRGSWYGVIFQVVSLGILALLVFGARTDHDRVTYTLILIMANLVWFVLLRLSFLISDYRYRRKGTNEP